MTIESAERRILEAIVGSATACEELLEMLTELHAGNLSLGEFSSAELEDGTELTDLVSEMAPLLARLQARAAHRKSGVREAEGPTDEALLVELLRRYPPSRAAVDRIVARLVGLRTAASPRRASALDATIDSIRRGVADSERAKATFVEANIGLVVSLAKRKLRHGMMLGDLVQEGSMGLLRAAEKFDHRRGVKFSTYAGWWVRHYINRALSDQSRTIRVPVHLQETRARVARAAQQLAQERGREPTEAELMERTGLPLEKLRHVLAVPREPVSLDAPVHADGDGRLGENVPDSAARSIVDELGSKYVQGRMRQLLKTLTPREQKVLEWRFGIDAASPCTLAEVGERLSVSRERARQIEAEALGKLRKQADGERVDFGLAG